MFFVLAHGVGRGLHRLLHALPELRLDTPTAAQVLGKFAARLVADDCLPPAAINPARFSDPEMMESLTVPAWRLAFCLLIWLLIAFFACFAMAPTGNPPLLSIFAE